MWKITEKMEKKALFLAATFFLGGCASSPEKPTKNKFSIPPDSSCTGAGICSPMCEKEIQNFLEPTKVLDFSKDNLEKIFFALAQNRIATELFKIRAKKCFPPTDPGIILSDFCGFDKIENKFTKKDLCSTKCKNVLDKILEKIRTSVEKPIFTKLFQNAQSTRGKNCAKNRAIKT